LDVLCSLPDAPWRLRSAGQSDPRVRNSALTISCPI